MGYPDHDNEDRILEIFAVLTIRGFNLFDWDEFQESFKAALKVLGDEVRIWENCVRGDYPELYRTAVILMGQGFCYWVSPSFKRLQLTMSSRDAHIILERTAKRKLAEDAAAAWLNAYHGVGEWKK